MQFHSPSRRLLRLIVVNYNKTYRIKGKVISYSFNVEVDINFINFLNPYRNNYFPQVHCLIKTSDLYKTYLYHNIDYCDVLIGRTS